MNTTDLETSVPYKLGQMDARIGNIETAVAGIQADVKTLLASRDQQKGGRATVAAWGSGGVGLGGLVVAALQFWLGGDNKAVAAPTPPAVVIQPAPQYQQPRADVPVNQPAQL